MLPVSYRIAQIAENPMTKGVASVENVEIVPDCLKTLDNAKKQSENLPDSHRCLASLPIPMHSTRF